MKLADLNSAIDLIDTSWLDVRYEFGRYGFNGNALIKVDHLAQIKAALLDALRVIRAADRIRFCQKAYLADIGNEEKGKAVGEAMAEYDKERE